MANNSGQAEKFVLTLDSSQLSLYSDCPCEWNYQNRERLALPTPEDREAMNAGTYGHQIFDVYYTRRAQNASFNQAYEEALAFDPDKDFMCKCGHIKKDHTRSVPAFGIGPLGCTRCSKVCFNFDPVPYELTPQNRSAVVEATRRYFFFYRDNDFVPNNPHSVEVGFSEAIYEDEYNLFILEGRIDLIGTLQGLPIICDHKFQFSRKELYTKAIQPRNYDLVCQGATNTFIYNYVRLTKKVDETTLERRLVSFNAVERMWWKREVVKMFFQVKESIINNHFEQRWSNCQNRYNRICRYTPLCECFNEDVKELRKKQLYTIKTEVWRPW